MKFNDIPLISTSAIFRAADVSATRGNPLINELERQGRITPVRTPTHRTKLSPRDGEILYEELVDG